MLKEVNDYLGGQLLNKIMNLYKPKNDYKPNFNLIRADFIQLLKLYEFRYIDICKFDKLTCLTVKHSNYGFFSIILDNYFDINEFVDTSSNKSVTLYLRTQLVEWKKDSMLNCNYKCVLTGDKIWAIHHLYSFNLILREIENLSEYDIYQSVLEIDEKELWEIVTLCQELHKKYPLGVCLNKNIHMLFHQQYGYGNNTPEQFEEFKTRLKDGEFIDFLVENKLSLII